MRIRLSNNKKKFTQYDTGQYFRLESCPADTEVYIVWSGSASGKADKLTISDKKAIIPDQVLKVSGVIKVSARYKKNTSEWMYSTEDIEITPHPMPNGYIANETQFADYISRSEVYLNGKLTSYRTSAQQDLIDSGKANVSDVYTKAQSDAKYLTEHQSLSAYRTSSAQDVIDSGKVDKITGKGLSTNDYDQTAKAKVDAIPSNPKYTDTVYDDSDIKSDLYQYTTKYNSVITLLGQVKTALENGQTSEAISLLDNFLLGENGGVLS